MKWFNQYFQDNRKRIIYYDARQKIGYVIPPQSVRLVNVFHQRFTLAILLGFVLFMMKTEWYYSVLAAVVSAGLLEWVFKQKILRQFTQLHKYNLVENTLQTVDEKTLNKAFRNALLRAVLALVFIVFSFLNQPNQQTLQTVLLVLVGGYFLLTALHSMVQIQIQRKQLKR